MVTMYIKKDMLHNIICHESFESKHLDLSA